MYSSGVWWGWKSSSENINNIEPKKLNSYVESELDPLLCKIRTTKQKQLLTYHFLDLKETYMLLQVSDDGILTDLKGYSIDLKNTLL